MALKAMARITALKAVPLWGAKLFFLGPKFWFRPALGCGVGSNTPKHVACVAMVAGVGRAGCAGLFWSIDMSRYPSVRPKPAKPQRADDTAVKVENTIRDAAHELYRDRGGAGIDAAIVRYQNMLELHDEEVAKLKGNEDKPYRWKVSPSVVIRVQREIERLQEKREALRAECWALAQQLVDDWMRNPPAQATANEREQAPQVPVPGDSFEKGQAPVPERSTAEATTSAA